MKRLTIAAALCLVVPGCNLPPPNIIADQTKLDEHARIGFGLTYVTASTLGNRMSRAGLIDRPQFQALDREAYAALQRIRAAYAAGNATDLASARAAFEQAIGGINRLAGN